MPKGHIDTDLDNYEHETFQLDDYDEDEDLFTRKKKGIIRDGLFLTSNKNNNNSNNSSTILPSSLSENSNNNNTTTGSMLRFRYCAAVAALFRQPSEAVRSLCWVISRNILLILVYFALSIGLTFYQNHLLKEIHFPLSVVLCHLVVKFLLASLLRLIYEIVTRQRRVLLDCENWLKKLSLIGISGGLDIGFSNWGQEFVTVSLYTMSKSTAIIFILGFALFFKLEEKHWSLFIIVGMISGGLIMFTYESTQFNLLGFSLIMTASFLSGLRWSMCQLVVQKTKLGLQNPIDMVYHVQPWMIIAVLPFALFFEGSALSRQSVALQTDEQQSEFIKTINSILIGALMAFFMEVAEYLVVSYTSSLTLSVAGIFKEICTLCLAVIYNKDQLNFINFLGLVLCFTGIILHVGIKFAKSTGLGGHLDQTSSIKSPTSVSISGGPGSRSGNTSATVSTSGQTSSSILIREKSFSELDSAEIPLLAANFSDKQLHEDRFHNSISQDSDDDEETEMWKR